MGPFLLAEEAWWQTLGTQVIWIAGFLTALGIILKTPIINRPFKWVWRRLVSEPLAGWGERMVGAVVDEKVSQPNGGGSLRDRMDALGESQTGIRKSLENLHKCINARFVETQARIEKLTKYSEEVLAEAIGAKERIRQLYRGLDMPVFEANVDGFCTYVNPAYCKLTGLTLEDALGEGWAEALHPEDRARVFKTWRRAVESHSGFTSVYRFRDRSNGDVVEVRGSASPLHDGCDNIVGWVGTLDLLEPSSTLEMELKEAQEVLNA